MEIADKCKILNELWSNYRHDEEFEDFFSYNDLGLPIAVLVAEEIMPMTPRSMRKTMSASSAPTLADGSVERIVMG